jgi:O-antigen/teichoic acid export membrane protein
VYLSKDNFGIINWMNAMSFFILTLLGFGLEQVVVRRIAASRQSDWAAAAFFAHAIFSFIVTLLVLVLLKWLFNNQPVLRYLPWFFAAQGLIYMGIPLKQFLNAKERFTPYGVIAVVSNLAKIIAVLLIQHAGKLDTGTVVIVLISAGAFELLCLLIYILTKTAFSFKLHFRAYTKLIRESSAQYLSVIFDMSLSRMDWILLGLMTSNIVLADYSFAYRAYELSRLPMLIIAPVILPRFSKLMASGKKPGNIQQFYINAFSTVELFFAVLIPLIINVLWIPVVGFITHGKYGEANSWEFLILSLCIPMQFFINLLWTISFAAKKYKSVSTITIICAVTNIVLNLVLIRLFNGIGAAIAFFVTTLLQSVLFYRLVDKQIMAITLRPFLLFAASAVVIYCAGTYLNIHFLIRLAAVIILYVLSAVLSGQIKKHHLTNFKHFLSR